MADAYDDCRYFSLIAGKEIGSCRRYPPAYLLKPDIVIVTEGLIVDNRWPMMKKEDWCGEYKN